MKHKKFKHVTFDNKKRVFHLEYTTGLRVECPYSALGIREGVTQAAPDSEVGNHSFYFVLKSGKRDYVPYDQPLHIVREPEYAREEALYEITLAINEFIRKEKIPKRELARRLNTSMSQLGRLLNPANYNKELSRLIQIAAMLNYRFKWEFRKAI